jgi:hypothetical protein
VNFLFRAISLRSLAVLYPYLFDILESEAGCRHMPISEAMHDYWSTQGSKGSREPRGHYARRREIAD